MKGLFHALRADFRMDEDMADSVVDHEEEVEFARSWFDHPRGL